MGVTKAISDRLGKGGIADRMIWFNGFPFLDNKEEHTFGVPVSQIMTSAATVLPATGLELKEVERILAESKFQGYPVVEDRVLKVLLGYIGRTELRYAIDRARKGQPLQPNAKCLFAPSSTTAMTPLSIAPAVTFDTIAATSGQSSVDFSRFVDPTPLAVHPRLPLETVMELFKKMGPRVILIEYRGKLAGLVTVKDCLKYQFKVEAQENPRDDSSLQESQEKLWEVIKRAAAWVQEKINQISGGRLALGDTGYRTSSRSPGDRRSPTSPTSGDGMLDGTEEDSPAVELEDR